MTGKNKQDEKDLHGKGKDDHKVKDDHKDKEKHDKKGK